MKAPSELDVSSGGRELHMTKVALVPDSTGTALGLQQPSPLAALQINSCCRVRNAAPNAGGTVPAVPQVISFTYSSVFPLAA